VDGKGADGVSIRWQALGIALHGDKIVIGDPVKMARAMIASGDLKPAPWRLVLGSDA
jgi:hypothetical protein